MIISEAKPLAELQETLAPSASSSGRLRGLRHGDARPAARRCSASVVVGREETTGSVVIDEACHIQRAARDLRHHAQAVGAADALVVLACGSGVQSISSNTDKRVIGALNSLFLGNVRRVGQYGRCALCAATAFSTKPPASAR